MTVREAMRRAEGELAGVGIDASACEARLLMAHVLGDTPGHLPLRLAQELAADAEEALEGLLRRRVAREPLAYVIGETEYMGLPIRCDRRALIPRPDTETLVESILLHAPAGPALVADIGTGTGCIAIALARNSGPEQGLPDLRVVATDISPDALALAEANVALNGVVGRVQLLQGPYLEPLWDAGLADKVSILTSNPPYVPDGDLAGLEPEVRQAEPKIALMGGPDGLDWYRRVVPELVELDNLELVGFEVGMGQAPQVTRMVEEALEGWRVWVERDLGGVERVVMARRA